MVVAGIAEGATDMSYTRDGDRRTRGVGAIAAADNVSRARRMRQSQVNQITRNRDRTMAAIAQGALGRVAIGPGGPVIWNEGRDATQSSPPPSVPPPPPATTVYPGSGPMYIPPPSVPPPVSVIPPPSSVPPVAMPPPGKIPVVISPPAGSGGGASGITLGPGGTPIQPIPNMPVIDIPEAPDAEDHTARNVMIAGGVALAAYLLFRRSP